MADPGTRAELARTIRARPRLSLKQSKKAARRPCERPRQLSARARSNILTAQGTRAFASHQLNISRVRWVGPPPRLSMSISSSIFCRSCHLRTYWRGLSARVSAGRRSQAGSSARIDLTAEMNEAPGTGGFDHLEGPRWVQCAPRMSPPRAPTPFPRPPTRGHGTNLQDHRCRT